LIEKQLASGLDFTEVDDCLETTKRQFYGIDRQR
jgi:hypothetical protein